MEGSRRWTLRARRSVVVLTGLVVVGQVVGFTVEPARSPVFGLSLVGLDALGLIYSVRAARRSASRRIWGTTAAGRGLSVLATVSFTVAALTGNSGWPWFFAIVSGLAMFTALSAACLAVTTERYDPRQRRAFLAEAVTVLSSAFVVAWYFILHPAIDRSTALELLYDIGYPLGNLLLLAAVCAVLLRGAVAHLTRPVALLLGGMLLYAVGDIAFSAMRVHGEQGSPNTPAGVALVFASLLMTVGAMEECALPPTDRDARLTRMPAWSMALPYVAVAVGNVMMLVAVVHADNRDLWGGLLLGQALMTTALAVRQLISLRESSERNVVDPLTGLANLTGLKAAARRAQQRREPVALLLLDLDGFKQINDRYGHEVGNSVLVEFARTLRGAIRGHDTAARVGGDEFVILQTGATTEAQAVVVAERVLAALADTTVRVGDETIPIRTSIGLALGSATDSPQELQHKADLAMYESKRAGTHGWKAYDESMTDRRNRDALLAAELERAGDQLSVLYQPLVDLSGGGAVAVETLLRWQHPTLGAISPAEFVPIAERSGAIDDIGRRVLDLACRQVRAWIEAGADPDFYASVNVSPRQLEDPAFLDDVLTVLERSGLAPRNLVLEITETAIVDQRTAIPVLTALRERGIRIAIDDFGTGYSALHYLTRLPVDVLKIDGSFIAQLNGTRQGAAVTEAIIRLGRILELTTVGEGIETAAQAAELQALGCAIGQGYLFARPATAADLDPMITGRSPGTGTRPAEPDGRHPAAASPARAPR
ncbi:putative bifunctional diguanylate cyclase/phosphodiesterase [Cryptosporangium arvum]|uniref:Diguanylate cyclase (GGDEF) domain-containing protein n=1 Tax=Cryptosporangium arvum DSM 44712 TaxID=927661 RepID=A0A010ZWG9_9ACTN|nr:bifunctional diguanylate cyclase/phosphodiesterase [Cryptosporangium arvum]EXG83014.1 diguanylate cyclase (GGDEF) domain-containing protein [Cryptosporangium arvum DSM 44712]